MPESVVFSPLQHIALHQQMQSDPPNAALSVETNGHHHHHHHRRQQQHQQQIQATQSDHQAATSTPSEVSGGGSPDSSSSPSSSPRGSRDSSWLQVEVCRDFRRDTCPRGFQCRFAHPDAKVMGKDGKVTCCYDFLKGRCNRNFCKYYHPPAHIKEKLVSAGKQFGAMMSAGIPRYPALVQQPMPHFIPGQWNGLNPVSPVLPYGDRLLVCPEFLAGQCQAFFCPYVHPGPNIHINMDHTVTICRNFVRGACIRGDQCRYYHLPYPLLQHHQPILPTTPPPPPLQGFSMGQPLLPVYLPPSPPPPLSLAPMGPVQSSLPMGVQSPLSAAASYAFVPPAAAAGAVPVVVSPIPSVVVPTPVSIIKSTSAVHSGDSSQAETNGDVCYESPAKAGGGKE